MNEQMKELESVTRPGPGGRVTVVEQMYFQTMDDQPISSGHHSWSCPTIGHDLPYGRTIEVPSDSTPYEIDAGWIMRPGHIFVHVKELDRKVRSDTDNPLSIRLELCLSIRKADKNPNAFSPPEINLLVPFTFIIPGGTHRHQITEFDMLRFYNRSGVPLTVSYYVFTR